MGPIGVPELLVILMIGVFGVGAAMLMLWPAARCLRRIGFSPWLSLVALIPFGNIVLLWVVAYSDWRDVQASGKG
jgi:hypothetical protein